VATVVTLSASFGAGGGVIGPRVADRLGLPFLDRAIPAAVAEALAVPTADAIAHDERCASGLGRLFAGLAQMAPLPDTEYPTVPSMGGPTLRDQPEQAYRNQTELVLHQIADFEGGVILGRAGAFVLHDHPGVLHVRLDGPLDARVQRAVELEGVDEERARQLAAETDRARETYVKHFYKCDARDARHYHLVLDSTAFELDACVDVIVTAARARPSDAPTDPRIPRRDGR
jgi:hypothetical protein